MKKILTAVTALSLLSAGFIFAQDYEEFEEASDPVLNISGVAGASGRMWVNKDEIKSGSKGADSEMENNAYLNLDLQYIANSSDFNAKLKFDSASIKDNPGDIVDEFIARGYFAEGAFTIEAGKEKLVWGKGDKQHVLDNFNANNYTDFVIPDYIDRRIAEPMVRIAVAPSYMNDYISNIKLEGVWTPMMTADRFASSGQWVPNSQKTLTEICSNVIGHNLAIDVTDLDGSMATAGAAVSSIMDASSFSADDLYEDNIKTLKYGQAGARFTTTIMGVDLGLSYYYGHYKQPTANLENYVNSVSNSVLSFVSTTEGQTAIQTKYAEEITNLATKKYGPIYTKLVGQTVKDPLTGADVVIDGAGAISTLAGHAAFLEACNNNAQEIALMTEDKLTLPSLNYDQLQTFGLEAAFVFPDWLLGLNTRYEFAYNLTEDTTGDNPWVKNNSIGWVAGFDRDLPIHNVNVNFQTVGKYILNNDKITNEHDTDYNTEGKWTNNKLILNVSDKFLNEKLTVECSGVYVVETKGVLVMPKIEYNCADGLTLGVSGAYIKSDNENCEFYNFTADADDNWKAFVQLSAKYQF